MSNKFFQKVCLVTMVGGCLFLLWKTKHNCEGIRCKGRNNPTHVVHKDVNILILRDENQNRKNIIRKQVNKTKYEKENIDVNPGNAEERGISPQRVAGKGAVEWLDSYMITNYITQDTSTCTMPVCDLAGGHEPAVIKTGKATEGKCHSVNECVTVTVKTRHRLQYVSAFIKSLHLLYPGTRVVVADEFNPKYADEAPEQWKHLYDNDKDGLITYLQTKPGVGYGRHLAAQIATTKYILIADDDYLITNNTKLTSLLNLLESTDLSIAAGAVNDNYPFDGALKVKVEKGSSHLIFYPHVFHQSLKAIENCFVSDVVKNFFLANRLHILQAGGWDRTRLYYEHEDFFFTMRYQRLKVAFCPEVVITHDTRDRDLATARKSQFEIWSKKLKEKWGFVEYYYCMDKTNYLESKTCKNTKKFG